LRDLTVGSVESHLLRMALPIAAGMLLQTLYFVVDLYFVSHIGATAIAGVAAAANVVFIVMALTQIVGAGTLALMSQAAGRKDQPEAQQIFNQSMTIAAALTLATILFGFPLATYYMRFVAANAATAQAGVSYLDWFMPGLAMQYPMTAIASSLRATGIVRPTLLVQAVSVLLNIVLAPVLIAGWGTGHSFGVAGAGLASSLAIAVAVILLFVYFERLETFVRLTRSDWRPRWHLWRRLVLVGLPAGGEFAFIALYTLVIFAIIRHFGSTAQAGYGIGTRLTQAIFLPGIAIAFAAAPIAGQNFGAGHGARVRATLKAAILSCSVLMVVLTLLCQLRPEWLVGIFTNDPRVMAQGTLYMRIISWNFIATGIVYSCSAMFQALGNTIPTLVSTATRLLTFILPVTWLATLPHFRIEDVWYLSVATVALQAATSLLLVAREFRRRLPQAAEAA
jgi:putative MATE family efflux protein